MTWPLSTRRRNRHAWGAWKRLSNVDAAALVSKQVEGE